MDTDGPDIERPNKAAIEALLTYAIAELRHATARHQKAWAKMRKLQEELDGQTIFKDSNAHWQLAVGDVRWWREERASAAANVTALAAALPFATGLPRN
jgi:ferric-dicitrate binding protein FerR (iron transport regulator)